MLKVEFSASMNKCLQRSYFKCVLHVFSTAVDQFTSVKFDSQWQITVLSVYRFVVWFVFVL